MEMQVSRSLKAMKARKVMPDPFYGLRNMLMLIFLMYRGDKISGIHSADRYIIF